MDYTQYEEVKAGEKMETKVTEVNEGKQSDFRSSAYFDKIEGSKDEIEKIKESPALQVICDNGSEAIINLPNNNRISPKSKLAMWKRTYGDFPKVGQVVQTKSDENGFFRVVLEAS